MSALRPVAVPVVLLALLGLWSVAFVGILLLGPAAPTWAAGLLALCGYRAEQAASRLDASAAILVQSYLFGGVVAWIYWDDLRPRLRAHWAGRLLGPAALVPAAGLLFGVAVGRLALPPAELAALDAPAPRPTFSLVDQNGRTVASDDLAGRVVLLTFFYADCHDTCPLTVRRVQQVLDQLAPDRRPRVAALGISVNPEQDTPDRLRQTASAWALSEEFRLLTGQAEAVRRLAGDLGVEFWPQPDGTVLHPDLLLVFDRQGRAAYRTSGPAWEPAEIVQIVERLLASGED